MFGTCDDSLALDSLDVLAGVNTRKERICSPSFPVPSSSYVSGKIHHRTETVDHQVSFTTIGWRTRTGTHATLTPLPLNSAPIAAPRSSIRFLSHVAATFIAEGNTEL